MKKKLPDPEVQFHGSRVSRDEFVRTFRSTGDAYLDWRIYAQWAFSMTGEELDAHLREVDRVHEKYKAELRELERIFTEAIGRRINPKAVDAYARAFVAGLPSKDHKLLGDIATREHRRVAAYLRTLKEQELREFGDAEECLS